MNPDSCFFGSIPEIFKLFLQYFPDRIEGEVFTGADMLSFKLSNCAGNGITGKDLDLRCQQDFREFLLFFINADMIDQNDDYQVRKDVFKRFCLFLETLIESKNEHLHDAGIKLIGYLAGQALFDEVMLLDQSERVRPYMEKALRNLNIKDQCARRLIDLFPAMRESYMRVAWPEFGEEYLVFILYERFGIYIVKTADPAVKRRAIELINEMYRSDDEYIRILAHEATVEIMATEPGFDFDEMSSWCSPEVGKDIMVYL